MKIIKQLVEMIEDELEGAEEYAKCAIKHKADHPMLARALYDISVQEMVHVKILHDEVVRVIDEYRAKSGDPPASMLAVYEYMHERHIDEAKEVRQYQEQYREE